MRIAEPNIPRSQIREYKQRALAGHTTGTEQI